MRPFRFTLFLGGLTCLLVLAGYLWTPLVFTSPPEIPAPAPPCDGKHAHPKPGKDQSPGC